MARYDHIDADPGFYAHDIHTPSELQKIHNKHVGNHHAKDSP